jgi:O-antigen ligase/tetratricopeptide (TPR) repeat protein
MPLFTIRLKKTFENNILKTSWIFFLLSLVSPLIVTDSLIYPYVTGKTLFFEACVELSFICWLLALVTQQSSFFWQKYLFIFPLFLLILLIINATAFDAGLAFWSNLERLGGFWLYLHTLIWAFLLYQLQSAIRWALLSKVTLATGIVVGISALFISTTSQEDPSTSTLERFVGTIGNPAFLAVYMLFLFFLGLNVFVSATQKWTKILLIGLCVFFLVILAGTQNRGTLLGFMVGVPLLLTSFFRKTFFEKYTAKIIIGYLGIILTLGIALFLNRDNPMIITNSILKRFPDSTTLFSRIYNWEIAYHGFLDKIFVGWGLENYTYVFPIYYNPAFYVDNSWYDHPHNVFLGWLVSGGILGFSIYLLWWVQLVFFIKKSSILPTQKAIWGAFLLAFLIHSCFLFDNFISLAIFLGLWVYALSTYKTERAAYPVSKQYRMLLGGLLVVSMGVFVFITVQTYRVADEFVETYNTSNLAEKTKKYAALYDEAFIGKYEIADIIGLQATQIDDTEAFEEKEAFQRLALDVLNRELESHPTLGKLLITKATLLQSRRELGENIKTFEQIRDVSPNRPLSWVSLGQAYSENKQYNLALTTLDKAHKLNPDYYVPLILKLEVYSKLLDTSNMVKTVKQLPTPILSKNVKIISQIFQNISFEKGFINLVSTWQNKEFFNKDVYQEWATIAYKLKDSEQVTTAVYGYHRHMYIKSDFDPYLRNLQKKILRERPDPKPYFELDENFWRLHSTNL